MAGQSGGRPDAPAGLRTRRPATGSVRPGRPETRKSLGPLGSIDILDFVRVVCSWATVSVLQPYINAHPTPIVDNLAALVEGLRIRLAEVLLANRSHGRSPVPRP